MDMQAYNLLFFSGQCLASYVLVVFVIRIAVKNKEIRKPLHSISFICFILLFVSSLSSNMPKVVIKDELVNIDPYETDQEIKDISPILKNSTLEEFREYMNENTIKENKQ